MTLTCLKAWRPLVFGFMLVCAPALSAETLRGMVVKIVDGDTLTVLDGQQRQHTIRIGGIDAPERSQAFGQVSRSKLAELVFNKPVEVEWAKRDRYGRIIGKVVVAGDDIGLQQIRKGLAWHYKYFMKDQTPEDRQSYAAAELGARGAKAGLWKHDNPQAPWDFRRKR